MVSNLTYLREVKEKREDGSENPRKEKQMKLSLITSSSKFY